jgi:ketol-acid reductoisomerase
MEIPKIYKDSDADINIIKSRKVGIVGFGNQGRAQALNLKDSGVDVCIGLRHGSASRKLAESDGIKCFSISKTLECCDMISLLVPDQIMGEVYKTHIAPNIKEGQTLLFAHGYNIHYKVIQPPEFINVVMAAPSGAGTELRKQFQAGNGIPGLFAIEQDYTQDSRELLLSYCKAIGLTRMGVFESTFKEETETDLFGEQIILTGGIPKLIQSSYKVLLESGYSPVTAWFVCYYELKTIVDMFHSKGFEFMNSAISDTAEYGGITRGKRIIDKHVENEMRSALKEIQSGEFHKEWQKEAEDGFPTLSKLREEEKNLPIQKIANSILKDLFEKK